jgi:hypothetical protein
VFIIISHEKSPDLFVTAKTVEQVLEHANFLYLPQNKWAGSKVGASVAQVNRQDGDKGRKSVPFRNIHTLNVAHIVEKKQSSCHRHLARKASLIIYEAESR